MTDTDVEGKAHFIRVCLIQALEGLKRCALSGCDPEPNRLKILQRKLGEDGSACQQYPGNLIRGVGSRQSKMDILASIFFSGEQDQFFLMLRFFCLVLIPASIYLRFFKKI